MTPQETLARFQLIARPIIRKYFRIDSCIGSTAITIGVLKQFGFQLQPFVCTILIFNKAMVERMKVFGDYPTPEELKIWTEKDCWSVGVGFTDRLVDDNKWAGHLCAVTAHEDQTLEDNSRIAFHLIDASADQASRPEKKIVMPGVLITEVKGRFVRGRANLDFITPEGAQVCYIPRLADTSYKTAPDWHDASRHVAAIREITEAIHGTKAAD